MNVFSFLQLSFATGIFIGAGSVAKSWALSPTLGKMALALTCYIAGNLIMMRLLRHIGMSTAFSLTGVLQVVVINLVAVAIFGEKVSLQAGIGIALAILGVILITFAPRIAP